MAEQDDDYTQSQREFFRDAVWRLIQANKDALAAEYAQAEMSGLVSRKSNVRGIEAHAYGLALFNDARRKNWL